MNGIRPPDDAATQRYEDRRNDRETLSKEIIARGVEQVEDRERLEYRRSTVGAEDAVGLERIIGESDLLGVNFLDLGLTAAAAVCRIQVRNPLGSVLGHGTGFLVSPELLLTNNHVLRSPEYARRSLADFQFEDDAQFLPKDTKTYQLQPERFFFTNDELDYTLVAVRPTATDGTPLSRFGFLPLLAPSGKALLNEYVAIVQHPGGGTKQIALRENRMVDVFDSFVHYSTDTLRGSSGSPVFNDQWEVVALHHASVKARDENGNVLNVDGNLWQPDDGESRIKWVANEGIRISSIYENLTEVSEESPEVKDALSELTRGGPLPSPGPDGDMDVCELDYEWYEGSTGYDADFLGARVELPTLAEHRRADIAPLKDGNGSELKYTHFSVVMSQARRLALFTAVNIDGDLAVSHRRGRDRWYYDPRMDRGFQAGPELYKRNDLDRGHLVRRLDPVWGERSAEANEDTFHFSNCAPQHKKLNQQTWLSLERYILDNAGLHRIKVTVFTGPVFRADDMLYRGEFQIPADFWKVVAFVKEGGEVSATAYLQTQKHLLEDLEFAYGEYRTYQVPISRIEALTDLRFGTLGQNDPIADLEATVGWPIDGPRDIRL